MLKARLMHRERDFDVGSEAPPGSEDVVQDLTLAVLFEAMAGGDGFLLEIARKAVLSGLNDVAAVLYRQDILRDCMSNPVIVRDLYDIAVEAIDRERKEYWFYSHNPSSLLHRSVNVLQMFVGVLRRLRAQADAHAGKFRSDGFTALFANLAKELDDEYLESIDAHIARLKFRHGVLISGRLGTGNLGFDYRLRRLNNEGRPWLQRLFAPRTPAFTFRIHERDEGGARAVAELRDRGINFVANAVAQANDHILGFFRMLRAELAFYVACLNLAEKLSARGLELCFPEPAPSAARRYTARGSYDICLALSSGRPVVANDVDADGKSLLMITGANEGGKSTFLRSLGLAQLMMQCGMFVPARDFCADLCTGIFTHFKREEDAELRHGKLDEELHRLSGLVDLLSPDAMILFNESFQSTNEREGSEIGRQVVRGLLESRMKVCFVTHMY
ncbi:MAG: DNA mismatch repair protein MutS, partial [Stellaceae bacterium]